MTTTIQPRPQFTLMNSTGINLCVCPANERWRYNVTSSLIGWAHIQKWSLMLLYKIHYSLLKIVSLRHFDIHQFDSSSTSIERDIHQFDSSSTSIERVNCANLSPLCIILCLQCLWYDAVDAKNLMHKSLLRLALCNPSQTNWDLFMLKHQ